MSATANTFSSLLQTIMRTPIDAVTRGEREYLSIWIDRLKAIKKIRGNTVDDIEKELRFAPVMKFSGEIQVAATVRLASVTESGGKLGLTIGTGPIGFSGGMSYSQRSSEESLIQISATFLLANDEISLLDYLRERDLLAPAQPMDVANAIKELDKDLEVLDKAAESKPARGGLENPNG